MRSAKYIGTGALAVAMLAAACGTGNDGASSSTETANAVSGEKDVSDDLVEMEITVSTHPVLLFSVPYIVAMEQGYFEEEGIRITGISGSEGGGTTVRNVMTGGLPIGEVATPAAAKAYLAGAPLKIVGGATQSVAEINWVTTHESGIETIDDLAGKSAGYTSPGSVSQGALALSLDRADGVDIDEVDQIAMGGLGEGITALQGGGIDSAIHLYPMYGEHPDEFKVLWWADEYVPDFQRTVLIASSTVVDEQPELIESFLRARAKGIEFTRNDPKAAGAMWAEVADIDPDVATASIERVIPDEYWGVGFSQPGMEAIDEQMRLIGQVEEDAEIPWSEMITQDYLPDGTETVELESVGGGE